MADDVNDSSHAFHALPFGVSICVCVCVDVHMYEVEGPMYENTISRNTNIYFSVKCIP